MTKDLDVLDSPEMGQELSEALSAARAWMEIVPEKSNAHPGTLLVGEYALLMVKSTLPGQYPILPPSKGQTNSPPFSISRNRLEGGGLHRHGRSGRHVPEAPGRQGLSHRRAPDARSSVGTGETHRAHEAPRGGRQVRGLQVSGQGQAAPVLRHTAVQGGVSKGKGCAQRSKCPTGLNRVTSVPKGLLMDLRRKTSLLKRQHVPKG